MNDIIRDLEGTKSDALNQYDQLPLVSLGSHAAQAHTLDAHIPPNQM